MLNNSCIDFINDVASKKPAPGGGGACAYVGALGMALGSMVGNLTLGKKKYAMYEEDIEQLLKESSLIIDEFEELVNRDAECFLPLAQAYGLPKATPEEKEYRDEIIQKALVNATLIPLEIARFCLKAIDLHEQFAIKGTKIAISDVGVGVVFLRAAFEGAKLNILINTKLMTNTKLKNLVEKELDILEDEVISKAEKIYKEVVDELKC